MYGNRVGTGLSEDTLLPMSIKQITEKTVCFHISLIVFVLIVVVCLQSVMTVSCGAFHTAALTGSPFSALLCCSIVVVMVSQRRATC